MATGESLKETACVLRSYHALSYLRVVKIIAIASFTFKISWNRMIVIVKNYKVLSK